MKKPCPDLVQLDDQQLVDFWKSHHPGDVKNLGDRLLAESLPRFAPRPAQFYCADLAGQRDKTQLSRDQMAELLNINASVIEAWETGEVRAPASLTLIYSSLAK